MENPRGLAADSERLRERRGTNVARAARLAIGVTLLLTAAKVVAWLATSSLAVLGQALDSALDVVTLGLLFVGLRIAVKPADQTHHYGHAKAENLVAFTQTLFLGLVAAGVAVVAVERLGSPPVVEAPWYALALLGGSTLVDAVRARWLYSAAKEERSDALLAGAINVVSDVGTSALAFVSLIFVRAGFVYADAIGGLIVAVLVAIAAIRVGKRSVDVLMDRAPLTQVEAIEAAANRAAGVTETRRVRVRGAGDQLFADVTVAAGRTATLERAHDIAEAVEQEIAGALPGTDVVVHVEPISETSGLVERAQAAASKIEGVHEIHNIHIHAFEEGGHSKLHVTLHAKVTPRTSLEDAHGLSERIEAAVEQELGTGVRVDTHIEPLRTTTPGRDVTADRKDVVDDVRRLAIEEPDILDCHEVLVTSADGTLSVLAHVRGRGTLALARVHEASDRIEKAIQLAHPDVDQVTIHFEPA